MRKVLFILMLICNISAFGQKLGHAYHFDFDSKSISRTGEFKDWKECRDCFMELYDESSLLTLADSKLGTFTFIVSKVEKDEVNNAMVLTCTGKGCSTVCTVAWQQKHMTFTFDDVALKYRISASHEENY